MDRYYNENLMGSRIVYCLLYNSKKEMRSDCWSRPRNNEEQKYLPTKDEQFTGYIFRICGKHESSIIHSGK